MFKSLSSRFALVGGVPALILPALAEVPATVTTAITDAKADAVTVAGLVLGIVFALIAFKWMKRAAN